MMGHQASGQERLFYSFNLEDHVPDDHLLRGIDRFLDLSELRRHLSGFYSHTGRPSIDPERMIRMLIIDGDRGREPACGRPTARSCCLTGSHFAFRRAGALTIHIGGLVESGERWRYLFSMSQNGQRVFYMDSEKIEQTGYKVVKINECSARLVWRTGQERYVTCDAPSIGTDAGAAKSPGRA